MIGGSKVWQPDPDDAVTLVGAGVTLHEPPTWGEPALPS